jgi:hypothetical protein
VKLPDGDAGDVCARSERRHILADEQEFRRDKTADAGEKVRRRAVIDRHDNDAAKQAPPEGDDPVGTVLAPEDDLVPFAQPELV